MENQRLYELLAALAAGQLSESEKNELAKLSLDESGADAFQQQIAALMEQMPEEPVTDRAEWLPLLQQAMAVDKTNRSEAATAPARLRRISFLRRWGWAAACLLLLGAGYYLFSLRKETVPQPQIVHKNHIVPGGQGAILTLADGSEVLLDSMGNGIVAQQNGAQIVLNNGQLMYDGVGKSSEEPTFNTMKTPRGRQFSVLLPDGSKVWLNASSSIRYPTFFNDQQRAVEITGEVYFEVAADTKKPFIVEIKNRMSVEVLGTSFNVNAYQDNDEIQTTLLQGSVNVKEVSGASLLLRPSQQAVLKKSGKLEIGQSPDMEQVMAWKNGIFYFKDAPLSAVMQQFSRWYDVEVKYEQGLKDQYFSGKIQRDMALEEVLTILEMSKVNCRIEGRTIIVSASKQ